MSKSVVLLSGGVDSTTLLYSLLEEKPPEDVIALSVLYGQKHVRELDAASRIAKDASVDHVVADLGEALLPVFAEARSSQVGRRLNVPQGHYADESMKATVVPNRNALLISVAGALAVSIEADEVAYAAHAGDHPIYPDCRPEFVTAMEMTLHVACGIDLYAPFIEITKTDVVKIGFDIGVPYALTYSCYEGRPAHCGLCGTCQERIEAFRDSLVPDPTEYEIDIAKRA